ncbi:MAG: CHAP domain-containing protein [Anaerolineae bacterium]|nr:CHAP domain-containing protein [Anaerolineae bacterium]
MMKTLHEKKSVCHKSAVKILISIIIITLLLSTNSTSVSAQEEIQPEPDDAPSQELPQSTDTQGVSPTDVPTEIPQINVTPTAILSGEIITTQETPEITATAEPAANIAPFIEIVEPATDITISQGDLLTIRWTDEDPDDNAAISLFLDSDDQPGNGKGEIYITQNILEDLDGEGDQFIFDTKDIALGEYYLWGSILDEKNNTIFSSPNVKVLINHGAGFFNDDEMISAQLICSGMPNYGTKMVDASYWEGVDVYSNGNNTDTSVSGTYGYEYQCVELVQRFYSSMFGYVARWGVSTASEMFTKHPSGITAYKNGSSTKPVWGDVIVFDGHVAIVTHWDGSKLYFVEQNWCDSSKQGVDSINVTIKNGKYTIPARGGLSVKGWLHSSKNYGPQTTLGTPSNVDTLRPTFKWSPVIAANTYTLQVSKKSNMASPFLSKSVSSVSYTPTSDLPKNTKLYWRVKASYSKNWSNINSFTTPNIPTTPILSSPADKTKVSNLSTIKLDWSNSSFPFSSVLNYYQVQVSRVSDFDTTVINTKVVGPTNSKYSIPKLTLSSGRTYYWRVKACVSSSTCGGWSSVRYFTTK